MTKRDFQAREYAAESGGGVTEPLTKTKRAEGVLTVEEIKAIKMVVGGYALWMADHSRLDDPAVQETLKTLRFLMERSK